MKEQYIDVKNAIYTGMSIYNILKKCEFKINERKVNDEDKKYLSLYLGIVQTKNDISEKLYHMNYSYGIRVNYNMLNAEEYLKLYNDSFVDIFNEINFLDLNDYFNYLLSKDIIIKLNNLNRYSISKIIKNKEKTKVKG